MKVVTQIALYCFILLLAAVPGMAQQQVPVVANDTAKNSNTSFIEILNSEYTDIVKVGTEQVTKIVGNVKLRNGTDMLYCDSAVLYQNKKVAEAFGNVSIEQADGTEAFADYLKYTGGSKTVYMKGDVILTDNKGNELWSDEVDYNLSTKVGKFYKTGTLKNESTLLSSKYGEYNLKSKDARFKGDVVVNDPEYTVTSEDIGYNTDTKLVRFYAPAVVQNESTYLVAKAGTYDAKNKIAKFLGRSNMIHNAQFIEADDIKYNKVSGWAVAKGNVVAIDTAMKTTLYSGFAVYNEISEKMTATDHPIMKRKDGKDSLFIFSDTVFSEPVANLKRPDAGPIDTAKVQLDKLINELQSGIEVDSTKIPLQVPAARDSLGAKLPKDSIAHPADSLIHVQATDTPITAADSLNLPEEAPLDLPQMNIAGSDSLADHNNTDTIRHAVDLNPADSLEATGDRPQRPKHGIGENPEQKIFEKGTQGTKEGEQKPRYFIAYHNVKVYADSAQAKCDSLRYSQLDSLMILYKNPVIWGRQSQILGDTIYALLDSSKIQEVYVPKNAIVIQQNGPAKAGMFDQIQGSRIHAFFVNNELDSAVAYPNAETIYFAKDDDDAYLGASQASSTRLRIQFKNRKIKKIHYLLDFKQTMTPMRNADPEALRLSRFKWREAERPKSLEELMKDATPFQRLQILDQPEPAVADKEAPKEDQKKEPKQKKKGKQKKK
ncbi:hypothetical protein DBR32_05580 [Taibaiella sp. KBW10]|uniref:OstA-like protein n=1 Tax=Taibaiella sp. KBW10 TaxID=2153357 RepID=UPI000F59DFFC|nr:OstA-like protein [Taibaiella sp. KBW10]RQO31432.1 hypothetical protein DBR32_05580 [Taibaiella sp. KBW10]